MAEIATRRTFPAGISISPWPSPSYRIRDEDRPRRTPPQLLQLLARAHKAGTSIGAFCDAIHARQGELRIRRIQGMLSLTKQYGNATCDQACAAALELGVSEYQFVRRYLERSQQAGAAEAPRQTRCAGHRSRSARNAAKTPGRHVTKLQL